MPELTIIRMPNGVSRYDLVISFLQLRKQIFVDEMAWPLYSYESIEFEQYDTFNAVYIIAHDGDKVLGGARLIRTDQRIGTGAIRYSYMIRDAYEGFLPGMPRRLCYEEPPRCASAWELTRLATLPATDVARDILHAANAFLHEEGASQCLFLGPPAFMRMAKAMGYAPTGLGPIVRNEDGAFLAFSCAVVPPLTVAPRDDRKIIVTEDGASQATASDIATAGTLRYGFIISSDRPDAA